MKINGGILGKGTNKIGNVVGATWKGINYLRQYATPQNPNTVLQQAQRTKFSLAVEFAKAFIGDVFNPYVDPFIKLMSGYNYFIKQNIALFSGDIDYTTMQITWGKLYVPAAMTSCQYYTADGAIDFLIPTNLGGNGAATDKIYACAYQIATKRLFLQSLIDVRSNGTANVMTESGGDPSDYVCYLWMAKYDGTKLLMVSNSIAAIPTAGV